MNWNFIQVIKGHIARRGLHNRDFSIISDDCWGGFVYQNFHLPYRTPFVGLFICKPCYLQLLENFDELMKTELTFIQQKDSKYAEELSKRNLGRYPVGLLGGSVEIHFLHYKSEKEAVEKWEKRKKRLNKENLLVKMGDRDFSSDELIARFDALPFKHKCCFSGRRLPYKSVITFTEFEGREVERVHKHYKKYMDIKKTLNSLTQ